MGTEKWSSLHDDLIHPYINRTEEKRDNTGFLIERMADFGITRDDLEAAGVDPDRLADITEEQYSALMVDVVRAQFDTFFPSVYDRWASRSLAQQRDVVERVANMYETWGVRLIRHGSEVGETEPNMVLSLEGADFVRDMTDVKKIHELGIRSVILQYNRPNALAEADGLTDLGIQTVREFHSQGVITDLAHCLPGVREHIMRLADEAGKGALVAYTHGAAQEDIARDAQYSSAAVNRGLSQEEIHAIIQRGGIIGLGISRPFFQSIEHVAQRINSICQIDNGPTALGIGSDFGGIDASLMFGITKPDEVAKLGNALIGQFGFSEATVHNILRHNVREWAKKVVGKTDQP